MFRLCSLYHEQSRNALLEEFDIYCYNHYEKFNQRIRIPIDSVNFRIPLAALHRPCRPVSSHRLPANSLRNRLPLRPPAVCPGASSKVAKWISSLPENSKFAKVVAHSHFVQNSVEKIICFFRFYLVNGDCFYRDCRETQICFSRHSGIFFSRFIISIWSLKKDQIFRIPNHF